MRSARVNALKDGVNLLLTSIVTSLLLVLAMPGKFGWWPFLFVALVPLLAFVARKGPRLSLSAGMVTGFLFYAGTLYWIVIVLGRYGGLPIALSVPSMLLLSFYMGVYMALFALLLSYFLYRKKEDSRVSVQILCIAPILWVGLDWLRGVLFSGFPWMDLSYGLFSQPVLLQVADMGGHHLVTFVLVLVNALVFYVIESFQFGKCEETGRKVKLSVCMAVVFLLVVACYSILRYQQLSELTGVSPTVEVTVVQGNVAQDEKWTPSRKRSTLDKYRSLAGEFTDPKKPLLVVWPETALPFFPINDPMFSTVTRWADKKDVWLLTGAPYFVITDDLQRSFENAVSYFNSALLINPSGKVSSRYDKQHLVPFGEYVPLRKLLPFLEPLVESVGNFSFGSSSEPLIMGDIRMGVLICYESIFPYLARKEAAAGANVLVNITNDAWYGRSSAPYQSFAMTVLRSVETRRSLVRAANTGISGFVDPVGRVIGSSPVFKTLSMSSAVPVMEGNTIFTRFGYLFAPVCLFVIPILIVMQRRKIKAGQAET